MGSRFVIRLSPRMVLFIMFIFVVWAFFGVFIFSPRNNINFITSYRDLPIPSESTPLTKLLLEIHRNQYRGKLPFHGCIGPFGAGGTGNHHMGIANMILYSIFTNSTIILPSRSYFNDEKQYFSDYFLFRNKELQKYIVYPSPDHRVFSVISGMKQACVTSYFSGSSPMSKLQSLMKIYSTHDLLGKIKTIVPEIHSYEEPEDPHVQKRGCDDLLCKEFFIEGKNQVFHSPKHVIKKNANIGCFPTYHMFYWAFHVFRSKKKLEYLCNDLKLCDGLNMKFIEKHCRNQACQYEGMKLLNNVFRSLFLLNEKKAEFLSSQNTADSSNMRKRKDFVSIGIHVRTLMTDFSTDERGVRQISKCLAKVMKKINEKKFRIFLSGDVKFSISASFLSNLRKSLDDENNLEDGNFFDDLYFDYNQLGQKYLHGFWLEGRNGKKPSKNNDKKASDEFSIQNQLFMDIHELANSDYLVLSQYSSFGNLVGSYNINFLKNHPYYFPLRGEGFSPMKGNEMEELMPCSDNIPFQPCPKSKCPADYLLDQ